LVFFQTNKDLQGDNSDQFEGDQIIIRAKYFILNELSHNFPTHFFDQVEKSSKSILISFLERRDEETLKSHSEGSLKVPLAKIFDDEKIDRKLQLSFKCKVCGSRTTKIISNLVINFFYTSTV